MVAVVFGRDVLILAMAAYGLLFTSLRKFPPSVWGKISTFFQIAAALVVMGARAGIPAPVTLALSLMIACNSCQRPALRVERRSNVEKNGSLTCAHRRSSLKVCQRQSRDIECPAIIFWAGLASAGRSLAFLFWFAMIWPVCWIATGLFLASGILVLYLAVASGG